jgi:hypothetical protein
MDKIEIPCSECAKKARQREQSGVTGVLDTISYGIMTAKEIIVAGVRLVAKNADYDLLAKERLSICQTCPKSSQNFANNQANDLKLAKLFKTRPNLGVELNNISECENPTYIKEETLKSACSLCGCPLFLRSFINPNSQLVVEQKQEGCLWKQ